MNGLLVLAFVIYLVYCRRQNEKKKAEEKRLQEMQRQREREEEKSQKRQQYISYNADYVAAVVSWAEERHKDLKFVCDDQSYGLRSYEFFPTKNFDTFVIDATSFTDLSWEIRNRDEKTISECIFANGKSPYDSYDELLEHILPFDYYYSVYKADCDIEKLKHFRPSSDYDGFHYWEEVPAICGYLFLPKNDISLRDEIVNVLLNQVRERLLGHTNA